MLRVECRPLRDFLIVGMTQRSVAGRREYNNQQNWVYARDGLYEATHTLTGAPADF